MLDMSFIGSLDGFDVRLVGNAFFALFAQVRGSCTPFEETVYCDGVCRILVFDE